MDASFSVSSLKIPGAFLVSTPVFKDARGAFEVFWESPSLAISGIKFSPTNAHHSYNARAGTLRGFHYQRPPHGQIKLVSCVSGSLWDVVVDLREKSPTFREWQAIELNAASGKALYIPAGCAHGFVTLVDNTTIAYLIDGEYNESAGAVVRWNDAKLGVTWPIKDPILSSRDANALGLDEL